jgi:ORF6N domain
MGVSMNQKNQISVRLIESKIFVIRGQKVMLDRDLAILYAVETKYLNRQVKRNIERFPLEFMFQLTLEEKKELVPKWHRLDTLKHSSSLPFVFTEHGTIMLASVLNSPRAIEASVFIVRAFVRLRELLASHKDLSQKLKELESKFEGHDEQIKDIINAINQLLLPPEKPKRQIGFSVKEPKLKYIMK